MYKYLIAILFLIGCAEEPDIYNEYTIIEKYFIDGGVDTPETPDARTNLDTEDMEVIPPPGCEGVIKFEDPKVETTVRIEAGISTRDLYYQDLLEVYSLILGNPTSLEGLQCVSNLLKISFNNETKTDILEPLRELKYLISFHFNCHNSIIDLSPLEGLVNLQSVYIGNGVPLDLTPLINNPGIAYPDEVWIGTTYCDQLEILSQKIDMSLSSTCVERTK